MGEGWIIMTDKPNCGNCSHLDEGTKRYCTCRKINEQVDGEDMGFVGRIGCLSHPGAREYLMKDVIKELERLKHESYNTPRFPSEMSKLNYEEYRRYLAYTHAISLIRDGVSRD